MDLPMIKRLVILQILVYANIKLGDQINLAPPKKWNEPFCYFEHNNKKKDNTVSENTGGQNKLSQEELERYRKENRCFKCSKQGHNYRNCPQRRTKNDTLQATNILSTTIENAKALQLCYVWGKIRDQSAFILLDPGSTHNFISVELAQRLGIQTEEMGPSLEAMGAFKGQQVLVTPLIGKLRLHIKGYVDSEEFYISPLEHEDVILGTPWFHRMYAQLKFPDRVVTFSHMGKDFSIQAESKGNTIPIVSNDALKKVMKSSLFAYMIYVKDSLSIFDSSLHANHEQGNNEKEPNEHSEVKLKSFLNEYGDCFKDSIPNELPPSCGEDDHKIELIQGSSPPNKPPYRVSRAQ